MQTGMKRKLGQDMLNCFTIAKGELAAEALYYDAYFKIKMENLNLQM
jgi:hypothetical protein